MDDSKIRGAEWPRRLFPGMDLYRRARRDVAIVDARDLDARTFREEFVARNQPVLVKGAARQWPALERWNLAYLTEHCEPEATVNRRRTPTPREWPAWETSPIMPDVERAALRAVLEEMASSDRYTQVRAGFPPLARDLLRDIGAFEFLPDSEKHRKALLSYASRNVYLYRNSFTDWHYHPGFEAVMCQVIGTKEVLLLDPSDAVWNVITAHLHVHGRAYDRSSVEAADLASIEAQLVQVEAGDGLYIPAWWWHVVEAVDDRFGSTIPYWWNSPPHIRFSPRFPAYDYTLWHDLPRAVKNKAQWKLNPRAQLARLGLFAGVALSIGGPQRLYARLRYGRRLGPPTR